MFISNNRPSSHLWGKENLVKHRKVSKYNETDCRKNYLFLVEHNSGLFDGKPCQSLSVAKA